LRNINWIEFNSQQEEIIMIKLTKIASVVLGAVVALGAAGVANASALLQIVGPNKQQEVIGDAGGTSYAWAPGPGPGAGLPTVAGNWPDPPAPGFAADTSFGGARGITGFHTGYLNLTEAANVTFQFMGGGDSTLQNRFLVDFGSGFKQIFQDSHVGVDGGLTNPCPVGPGSTIPACDHLTEGTAGVGPFVQNQYTYFFSAGLIPFQYITGDGLFTLTNDGTNNPDPHATASAGYFLGVDPYLATGTFQESGTAVYAGLTDRGTPVGSPPIDHDFQDMGVRISVPEPGSIFLIGIGMVGLAFGRRKFDIASSPVLAKNKLSKFLPAMPAFSPA
jgi:hypothetical protein